MTHLARNPAIRRVAPVPGSKTFHGQVFPHSGELAPLWSEEGCGRRARTRCVREYWLARPARPRRTHFAAARPCQTCAVEVLTPAVHAQKARHIRLSDQTGGVGRNSPHPLHYPRRNT